MKHLVYRSNALTPQQVHVQWPPILSFQVAIVSHRVLHLAPGRSLRTAASSVTRQVRIYIEAMRLKLDGPRLVGSGLPFLSSLGHHSSSLCVCVAVGKLLRAHLVLLLHEFLYVSSPMTTSHSNAQGKKTKDHTDSFVNSSENFQHITTKTSIFKRFATIVSYKERNMFHNDILVKRSLIKLLVYLLNQLPKILVSSNDFFSQHQYAHLKSHLTYFHTHAIPRRIFCTDFN